MIDLIPSWAGTLGGVIAGIVAVAFGVIQAFNLGWSKTEEKKDKVSSDLIDLLSKTVDTLKVDLKTLQDETTKYKEETQRQHLESSKETARLRGENETLIKILQGRDEQYIKFQQEGFLSFKRIETMSDNLGKLVVALEKHLALSDQK